VIPDIQTFSSQQIKPATKKNPSEVITLDPSFFPLELLPKSVWPESALRRKKRKVDADIIIAQLGKNEEIEMKENKTEDPNKGEEENSGEENPEDKEPSSDSSSSRQSWRSNDDDSAGVDTDDDKEDD